MNQTELAQIRVMIGEAVDASLKRVVMDVVQPIRDDLDRVMHEAKALETADRKHSGEHRELASDVERTSQNDLKQDATIAQILMKVDAIEKNQGAAKGERTMTAAMTQDLHAQGQKFLAKHPALMPAIVGFIVAVLNVITFLIVTWLQSRGH